MQVPERADGASISKMQNITETVRYYTPAWMRIYQAIGEQLDIPENNSLTFQEMGRTIESYSTRRTSSSATSPFKRVVLSGAPCVGKTTVRTRLQEVGFTSALIHTYRQQRPNERDGIDRHFVTRDRLLELSESGELFADSDAKGGLSRKTLIDLFKNDTRFVIERKPMLWNMIEPQLIAMGISEEELRKSLIVHLLPPSPEVLGERVAKRNENPVRSLADATITLVENLRNPHILYLVNDNVERVTQKILGFHGINV